MAASARRGSAGWKYSRRTCAPTMTSHAATMVSAHEAPRAVSRAQRTSPAEACARDQTREELLFVRVVHQDLDAPGVFAVAQVIA